MHAGRNPRDVKFELAQEIVARFHDDAAAARALQTFQGRFQRGDVPEDIESVVLPPGANEQRIANVLKAAALVASTSEANRMIDQGAVRMGTSAATLAKLSDRELALTAPGRYLLQVGKRRFKWVELTLQEPTWL